MNDIARPAADDFEVLGKTVVYDGFFRFERHRLRYRLFSGGWSAPIEREILERGHAAAVLLYDPDADRVVLIEQFRAAAIDAPGGPWLIEIVAGIIEPGETPADVVRREAVEEAGTEIGKETGALEYIGEFMLSPGGSSERLTMYCARVDATHAGGVHGLAHEGEDIRVFTMTVDEALAALADGRIHNANAVIALQWLALNRTTLRARWQKTG